MAETIKRKPLPSEIVLNKPPEHAPSIEEALRRCTGRLRLELEELKRRLPSTDARRRIYIGTQQ